MFVENKFTQLLTGFECVDIFCIYDLYDLVYQWHSQNAEKTTHIKGRQLDQAMIASLFQRERILSFIFFFCFFFVALRPMSTAMVIAGRSVHLTTLFPGQA